MIVFLDTEFTDFIDSDLISIGMVSEDGKYEFYAERNDFQAVWCSEFVKASVLPFLGQNSALVCDSDELKRRLWQWFASLPRSVQLAADSERDKSLLWRAFGDGLPPNLEPSLFDLRPLIDTTVFHHAVCQYHELVGCPWHHAGHDAHAHRAGWLAWMDQRNDCLS